MLWRFDQDSLAIRFAGRTPGSEQGTSLEDLASRLDPQTPRLARARQVHSATVLSATPGLCGEGDALITCAPGLALSVVTADCVPVLFAGRVAIAAAHAGWRGLASGVLPATLERLVESGEAITEIEAWIGPSIGACCYEVSDEVADAVVRTSSPAVVSTGTRSRPHLDVAAAAQAQLAGAGVQRITTVDCCTRCNPELLWSYRRYSQDGSGAGRNLSWIWRRQQPSEKATT